MKSFFSCKTRQLWRTILSLPVLVLALSLAVVPGTAYAVHDLGLFELDIRMGVNGDQDKKNDPPPPWVGDANTVDSAAAGDDWATIYADYLLEDIVNSDAFAISFVEDTFANNNINNGAQPFVVVRTPEVTFFTGGGSKDTNGIQAGPWLYDTVNDVVPDKNDIVNAFAAAYDNPANGHTIFYFGLDTLSVNGAANAGFWFFRNPIGLSPLAAGQTTGTFVGEHRDGDVFVAVAYTQGGRVGTIEVYKWVGDDATGSLVLQPTLGGSCAVAVAGDKVCGVINKLLPGDTFGEDPSFDYANTLVANNPGQASSYKYESAALVEFGLDVNDVLGPNIGCFSTFLAETRSSQSKTAQLKDFAFGAFPVCSIAVEKTGDTLSKIGDAVDYSFVVTNTGRATLYKQLIDDSLLGNLTDGTNPLIMSSTCGASLAPGASCMIEATRTVVEGDDPLPNTVDVVYTEFADPASLAFTASDDHSVNTFQPDISATKECTDLSKVGDTVDCTVTITNDSSADTPDLVFDTISDSIQGDLTMAANYTSSTCGASFAWNESCVITYSYVVPDVAEPINNTVTVETHPDGFTNDIDTTASDSVNLFQPGISATKECTDLSKVGDTVDCTVTITNDSSNDTPDLVFDSISDSIQGDLTMAANYTSSTCGASFAWDEICNITYSYVVPDVAEPINNTVTVETHPNGFTNDIDTTASDTVNLFQPSVIIEKSSDCAAVTFNGTPIVYTFTITNTGSADSPDLVLDSLVDSGNGDVIGNIWGGFGDLTQRAEYSAACDSLTSTDSCTFDITLETTALAPGIYANRVDVHYHPDGFTNDISDFDVEQCQIATPNPATVVIEKVLLNGEGLTFNYDSTGIEDVPALWDESLAPSFTPVIPQNLRSPFVAAGAGNGFATTLELQVNIPNITQDEMVNIEELLPLPDQVEFVSLECLPAVDPAGNLTGVSYSGLMATLTLGSEDFAFCRYVNEFVAGEQGCTPGYWKVPQHHDSWGPTGYTTGQLLNTVFVPFPVGGGPVASLGSDTMLDALNYMGGNGAGGAAQILLRAAVAAVLNASHPDIAYPLGEQAIIDAVSAALQSGDRDTMLILATDLDDANNGVLINNEGTHDCPLN